MLGKVSSAPPRLACFGVDDGQTKHATRQHAILHSDVLAHARHRVLLASLKAFTQWQCQTRQNRCFSLEDLRRASIWQIKRKMESLAKRRKCWLLEQALQVRRYLNG